MALEKGVNSYVSVQEFNDYCSDRIDMSPDVDDTGRAQALVSATSILDDLPWTGVAISETQPLAFPRAGTYFDPRIGRQLRMDPVPDRIQKACMELAFHLLSNENLNEDSGSVSDIEIGNIRISNIKKAPRIPLHVKNMIRPILVNQGASTWWRAN